MELGQEAQEFDASVQNERRRSREERRETNKRRTCKQLIAMGHRLQANRDGLQLNRDLGKKAGICIAFRGSFLYIFV